MVRHFLCYFDFCILVDVRVSISEMRKVWTNFSFLSEKNFYRQNWCCLVRLLLLMTPALGIILLDKSRTYTWSNFPPTFHQPMKIEHSHYFSLKFPFVHLELCSFNFPRNLGKGRHKITKIGIGENYASFRASVV